MDANTKISSEQAYFHFAAFIRSRKSILLRKVYAVVERGIVFAQSKIRIAHKISTY